LRSSPARSGGRSEGSGRSSFLGDEPCRRHRLNLGVDALVHLDAPRQRITVAGFRRCPALGGDDEIALRVAHQVLDHAFRLRVRGLAEVRTKPVVRGEAHVLRMGHHHVGHRAGFEASHPVGEHHCGNATQLLEALGEHAQCGLAALVGGEAHEAVAAPGQHRAEDLQLPLLAPVDDQMLARVRHPGPIHPSPLTPLGLDRRHGAAEVACRAGVPRRSSARQQPLGGDPSVGGGHALMNQIPRRIGVVHRPRRSPIRELAELLTLDDLLDRLVGGPTKPRRSPVAAQLLVRGDDVQLCPRVLQCRVRPPRSAGGW
jgi:hypothetical protein